MEKKVKIIIGIIIVIMIATTIGTFFYMNYYEKAYNNFVDKHPEVWIESTREKMSKSEYEDIEYQHRLVRKSREKSNTIFIISRNITGLAIVVVLATGIVFKVKGKKKN